MTGSSTGLPSTARSPPYAQDLFRLLRTNPELCDEYAPLDRKPADPVTGIVPGPTPKERDSQIAKMGQAGPGRYC